MAILSEVTPSPRRARAEREAPVVGEPLDDVGGKLRLIGEAFALVGRPLVFAVIEFAEHRLCLETSVGGEICLVLRNGPGRRSAYARPRAFSAHLPGATLADLIERACDAGARAVVAVEPTTGEGRGWLCFRNGRLVHASCGQLEGEPALAEMLAWPAGLYLGAEAPWPGEETIAVGCQVALLRAEEALTARGAGLRPALGEVAFRLSGGGEVLTVRGDAGANFLDAVGFAIEVVNLVGDRLATGSFSRVELRFDRGRCVMAREPDGSFIGLATRLG